MMTVNKVNCSMMLLMYSKIMLTVTDFNSDNTISYRMTQNYKKKILINITLVIVNLLWTDENEIMLYFTPIVNIHFSDILQ